MLLIILLQIFAQPNYQSKNIVTHLYAPVIIIELK